MPNPAPRDLRKLKALVMAVFALGASVSLTANVLSAPDTIVGRCIAAWPPIALMITVDLIARVPATGRKSSVLRVGIAASVGLIAAVLSYDHMRALAETAGGMTGLAAAAMPWTVDGMIIAASLCLLDLAQPAAQSAAQAEADENRLREPDTLPKARADTTTSRTADRPAVDPPGSVPPHEADTPAATKADRDPAPEADTITTREADSNLPGEADTITTREADSNMPGEADTGTSTKADSNLPGEADTGTSTKADSPADTTPHVAPVRLHLVHQDSPPTSTVTLPERIRALAATHPEWTQAQLAEAAGCTPRTVRRHLSAPDTAVPSAVNADTATEKEAHA